MTLLVFALALRADEQVLTREALELGRQRLPLHRLNAPLTKCFVTFIVFLVRAVDCHLLLFELVLDGLAVGKRVNLFQILLVEHDDFMTLRALDSFLILEALN